MKLTKYRFCESARIQPVANRRPARDACPASWPVARARDRGLRPAPGARSRLPPGPTPSFCPPSAHRRRADHDHADVSTPALHLGDRRRAAGAVVRDRGGLPRLGAARPWATPSRLSSSRSSRACRRRTRPGGSRRRGGGGAGARSMRARAGASAMTRVRAARGGALMGEEGSPAREAQALTISRFWRLNRARTMDKHEGSARRAAAELLPAVYAELRRRCARSSWTTCAGDRSRSAGAGARTSRST
jgi:hypothetical protein